MKKIAGITVAMILVIMVGVFILDKSGVLVQDVQKSEYELAVEALQTEYDLASQYANDRLFDAAYEHYIKACEAHNRAEEKAETSFQAVPHSEIAMAGALTEEAFSNMDEQILSGEPYRALEALSTADNFVGRVLSKLRKLEWTTSLDEYIRRKEQEFSDIELSYLTQIAAMNVQITGISDLSHDGAAAFVGWYTEQPWWEKAEPNTEYPSRLRLIIGNSAYMEEKLQLMFDEAKQSLGTRIAEYYEAQDNAIAAIIWYLYTKEPRRNSYDRNPYYTGMDLAYDIRDESIGSLHNVPLCLLELFQLRSIIPNEMSHDMSASFRPGNVDGIETKMQELINIDTYNKRVVSMVDGFYGQKAVFDLDGEYSTFSFEYQPTDRDGGPKYYPAGEDGYYSTPIDTNAKCLSITQIDEAGLRRCIYDVSGLTELWFTSAREGISWTPYSEAVTLSNVYFNK